MRIVVMGFFGLLVLVVLSLFNDPTPPPNHLRDNPPVIDANGYIVRWADRTPQDVYRMNQVRQAQGIARGPIPPIR